MAPSLEASAPVIAPVSASGIFDLLWLVIALPALGAAVILVLGNRRTYRWGPLLGCATVVGSFVISLVAFITLLGRSAGDRSIGVHLYTWFQVGTFKADG